MSALFDRIHINGLYKEPLGTERTKGQTLATVFTTQSVRTRTTFEAAAHALGMNVITVTERRDGEPLRDFGYAIAQVCDICVSRLPDDHDFYEFTRNVDPKKCKMINGGSGALSHPTQALIDVYTLEELNLPQGSKIALFGPGHNRAMRSFCELASRKYSLEYYPPDLQNWDVVYCVTFGHDRTLPTSLIGTRTKIMHPFPRGTIIPSIYDWTDNDLYHKQMDNAVKVRTALLASL